MPTEVNALVSKLIQALRACPTDERSFNPWNDYDPDYDCGPEAPNLRTQNLVSFLEARVGRARLVACAEATGYQGGRFTGIPLTCERLLAGHCRDLDPAAVVPSGLHPRTSKHDMLEGPRVTRIVRELGFCEPTSTYVWRGIRVSGVDSREILLWNIFPLHAHRPGKPLSNRALRKRDLKVGIPFVELLLRAYPELALVAVGNWADAALTSMDLPHAKVRHPSQGGGSQFRREFAACLDTLRHR